MATFEEKVDESLYRKIVIEKKKRNRGRGFHLSFLFLAREAGPWHDAAERVRQRKQLRGPPLRFRRRQVQGCGVRC